MPSLLAACVVHQLRPDSGTEGATAIDKRAVDGSIRVGRFGLRADVQVSRKWHGGLEQAVYAYSQEDADFWSAQLGRELHPGWFGENLRVEGLPTTGARVGDRWQVGEKVLLEVTSPRTPCGTFARWVGGADAKGWVKRFAAEERLGAYLRVLRTGAITAGDPITVVATDPAAPTLVDVYRNEGVVAVRAAD